MPGCCTSAFCFTDRPERPENGSKPGTGLLGRDFGDPRACLCHYTTDGACRSVGYIGFVYAISPMGKDTI